ncbi:MAG TPA: ATPase, T2SS/T4P/T4SS family [Gemmatimonadaceae bacterium]|nr:ATPase, T2SS/T4P/T4SS family [Gemmatimonadaceae bacterium]
MGERRIAHSTPEMPTNTLNGPGATAAPSPTTARPSEPGRPDAPRGRAVFEPGAFEQLFNSLVEGAVKRGATDIHVRAGDVVQARIDGVLVALDTPTLSPNDTRALAMRVLEANGSADRVEDVKEHEGSWSLRGVGRFRVNILRQRSSFMIIMRVISDVLPSFEQLGLPRAIVHTTRVEAGLIVVCGAPESGRSTTIAAIVNYLNTHAATRRHCVLVEQPIEYLHKSQQWSMTQREVGSDTDTFESGVRAAILQDADAIVVGGLEQPAVIEAAFRAVEAGRLVIGRMGASDASTAIRNLLQRMESEDQQSARLRIAEALHAVVAQKLIPRQSGGRRVLATQLLFMTPYVRETILDAGTADNLGDALVKGRDQYGTQTFDQSLADLVLAGEVAFDMAVKLAANPLDLELQLRGSR